MRNEFVSLEYFLTTMPVPLKRFNNTNKSNEPNVSRTSGKIAGQDAVPVMIGSTTNNYIEYFGKSDVNHPRQKGKKMKCSEDRDN